MSIYIHGELSDMYQANRADPNAQAFYAQYLNDEVHHAQEKGILAKQERPLVELAEMAREHQNNRRVTAAYANALFLRCVTLCEADDVADAAKVGDTLRELQKSAPADLSLAQSTALTFFALWGMQDYTDKKAARKTIQDLRESHPGDEVIDGVMAELRRAEKRDDIEQRLLPMMLHDREVLRQNCEKNPDDIVGAECYAEFLYSTAMCQAELWPDQAAETEETVEMLRAFAQAHPENTEIAGWNKKLRIKLPEKLREIREKEEEE